MKNLFYKNRTGKTVLKGKPLRHWIFMGFFIAGLIIFLSGLMIRIYLVFRQYFLLYITDYFLFAGFVFAWFGMKTLVSYIKIYEHGIKVRNNGMINYVRTRFIPFSQISKFYLEGKRHPNLILQLKSEKVVVPTILVKNYKAVMNELSTFIDVKP
jgi:hypothetical protein